MNVVGRKKDGNDEVSSQRNGLRQTVLMLLRYKAWADEFVFEHLSKVPIEELYKDRQTTFGNIVQTLNHVYVVDDIFHHHLLGKPHAYEARITPVPPELTALRTAVSVLDQSYIAMFERWSETDLAAPIYFEFVGGGLGSMTRGEIALHIVNHTSYHRGFVGDMLRQVPYVWPANDLTVFLRDHDGR